MQKKAEERIQQEIFMWYWNTRCLPIHNPREIIYHIPNEGKNNGQLTAIGLYPGAADLVFTLNGKHYYCEVKDDKGTQSPNQKKFQKHIEHCGHQYHVVRSLEQFQTLIRAIL